MHIQPRNADKAHLCLNSAQLSSYQRQKEKQMTTLKSMAARIRIKWRRCSQAKAKVRCMLRTRKQYEAVDGLWGRLLRYALYLPPAFRSCRLLNSIFQCKIIKFIVFGIDLSEELRES